MRSFILLLTISILYLKTNAQPPGIYGMSKDTVTVKGRIYAGDFLVHVITKPTFLKVYDYSPSHMLMIRIDSGDRKNFPMEPEKYFKDKLVSIRGVVSDYKGVSLIKISDPSMVSIDLNDNGPEPITSTGSYMSGEEFGFGKSDSIFRSVQDSVRKILAADPLRKKALAQQTPKSTVIPVPASKIDSTTIAIKKTEPPIVEISKPDKVAEKEKEPEQPVNPIEEVKTPPVIDSISENKTEVKENIAKPDSTEPETIKPAEEIREDKTAVDSVDENKPDKVQQIRLRNVPVLKATKTNEVNEKISDSTNQKLVWLKAISSQDFVPVVNETRIVQDGEIEMRTSPNTDAPVIAYLMKKMVVNVTFRSNRWSYVTVLNPDGTTGLSGFVKNKTYKTLVIKQPDNN